MYAKIIILVILAAILYNLGAALYHMISDKDDSGRMVKSLTRRVALSVTLIIFLVIAMATGMITPHSGPV